MKYSLQKIYFICIIILLLNDIAFFLIVNGKDESPLWIVAKLKNIEWRRSCLSTERCAEPRFQLITSLLNEFEMYRIDSPVNVESVLIRQMTMNVFFENAHPENVLLKGYVVGLDPLYKIPSECDKSKELLVFKSGKQHNISDTQSTTTIELQGRCFNAYIEVMKYQHTCPWCLQTPLEIENKSEMENKNNFILSFNHIPITIEMLIFFGIIILIMTTGCSICLISIVISRYKRSFKGESLSMFNNPKSVNTLIDTTTLPSQPTRYTNTSQFNNTLTRKTLGFPIESTYETIDSSENGTYNSEPKKSEEYFQCWMSNNVNRTIYPTIRKLELSRKSDLSHKTIPPLSDPKKINNIRSICEIQNSFI